MQYSEYKHYRQTLSSNMEIFDDLSPYSLSSNKLIYGKGEKLIIAEPGSYLKTGTGVRCILKSLFRHFASRGYALVLPEDVYPVYFELATSGTVFPYKTFNQAELQLPNCQNAVLLVANPLVPKGNYLQLSQVNGIKHWQEQGNDRWLIVDGVYDLLQNTMLHREKFYNTIFLSSLSKLALTPKIKGWAVTFQPFDNFTRQDKHQVEIVFVSKLQSLYQAAWLGIRDSLHEINEYWEIPDIGYMTTINLDYKILSNMNIAALPGSVFGIQQADVSVITCLNRVKNEICRL